jgi:hypothetical protein
LDVPTGRQCTIAEILQNEKPKREMQLAIRPDWYVDLPALARDEVSIEEIKATGTFERTAVPDFAREYPPSLSEVMQLFLTHMNNTGVSIFPVDSPLFTSTVVKGKRVVVTYDGKEDLISDPDGRGKITVTLLEPTIFKDEPIGLMIPTIIPKYPPHWDFEIPRLPE